MATRHILTYDDLAALPADGNRYELLEGELYVTTAPRLRHQEVVANLHLILAPYVRRLELGEVYLSPVDVVLTNITVVEPDLLYLDAERLAQQVNDRAVEGPATLFIEVLSPSTAAADRGIKRQLAARYGAPHYWLVDPDARLIETYRLVGNTYEAGPRLEGTAPAALPPFSDLPLDPAAVWR